MAALRRLQNVLTHSAQPSYLFRSRRGIASKLFVGGISFYTTEKVLSEAFSQFGQVIEAKIVTNRTSEKSKGFGFVTYASQDEADRALREMNGKPLHGRVIFVDHAKPKTFGGDGMLVARGPPAKKNNTEAGIGTVAEEEILHTVTEEGIGSPR
ncbi:unnamed protein product [Cuscuta epithymum]|uniref:RRM domain-containing protein n=1 Tax=Cuscuta epithymum TaxID=186058 RepID=A0AAV0CJF3_9ASTE|nr:unnamed protein product [Cuscuta epithymum]